MDQRGAVTGLVLVLTTLAGCALGNSHHHHRRRDTPAAAAAGAADLAPRSPYDSEYVSDWPSSIDYAMSGGRGTPAKCINIPSNLTLCKDIGYNQMRLPNLLDHDTLAEVTQQAASWVPLLHIHCHKDTKLFLCSLFSPVCLEKEIFPCRPLCEAVKAGCEKRMEKYGYPWPEMLRCDKFPEKNDLCILPQKNEPEDNICEPCRHPDTLHSLVDNYCQSDFVLRMKVSENLVIDADSALVAMKKKKKYKKGNLTKQELRSLRIFIAGGAKCECPIVTNALKTGRFIVMGRRVNGRLEATYIKTFDRKNKDQKRGLRKAQKENVCQQGLEAFTEGKAMKKAPRPPTAVTVHQEAAGGTVVGEKDTSTTKTPKKSRSKKERKGGKKKRKGRSRKTRRRKNNKKKKESERKD